MFINNELIVENTNL